MKIKWLLLVSSVIFLLVGCKSTDAEKTPSPKEKKASEVVTNEQSTQEPFLDEGLLSGAYYSVLNELVNQYGILEEDDLFLDYSGVAYAKLIDFDNDGIKEFYVVYRETDSPQYKEELWSYNVTEKKSNKIYHDYYQHEGRNGKATLSMVKVNEQFYLVETEEYSTGLSEDESVAQLGFRVDTFLKLESNSFREITKLNLEETYFLDDSSEAKYIVTENKQEKEVTKKEYEEFLTRLNYTEKEDIIGSDNGTIFLVMDLIKNKETITELLKKLKEVSGQTEVEETSNNSGKDVTMNDEELMRINAFLNQFSMISQYDVKSTTEQDIANIIVNGIFNQSFSDFGIEAEVDIEPLIVDEVFYFEPYDATKIQELSRQLFGKELERKNYGSAEGDSIKYQDGYFYIVSPNMGGDNTTYSTQLGKIKLFNDDLYYAEFELYLLDSFELMDSGLEATTFLKPFTTWGAKEKQISHTKENGYALWKDIDGSLQLISYNRNVSTPSKEDLESYIEELQ